MYDLLDTQPADVGHQGGRLHLGIVGGELGLEFRSPVDMDIALVLPGHVLLGAYQQQGFVEQIFDAESGTVLRGIHQADIDGSLHESLHDVLLEADLKPQRDIRHLFAHPVSPPG